jgi:MFS family permease
VLLHEGWMPAGSGPGVLELAGPLLLGHLFDTLGRKKMIAGTCLLSGSMLAASAWLFDAGVLHAAPHTFIWIVVFFFA